MGRRARTRTNHVDRIRRRRLGALERLRRALPSYQQNALAPPVETKAEDWMIQVKRAEKEIATLEERTF